MKNALSYIFIVSAIILSVFLGGVDTALAQDGPGVERRAETAGQIGQEIGKGLSLSSLVSGLLGAIPAAIGAILLKLTGFIAMISGVFLNGVVYFTVLKMTDNLPHVDTAWGVIRDVANMGFIFVLLYTAIKNILGASSDTRQLIVKMIIAAILINFSLFFTKFVIDIANLIALTFYDVIAPGAAASSEWASRGISNAFVEAMGVQQIWTASGGLGNLGNMAVMSIFASVIMLIAAFIFFAVAIMLVIRFVVLIFVLILSPIAFVAQVLPNLKDSAKQWTETLLGQAFFAPIYFLLTWVTLYVVNGLKTGILTEANWESLAAAGEAGAASSSVTGEIAQTVINFAVIIGFMILSLIIAKSWAGKGFGLVQDMTKWATGFAGGATLGLAGKFGRGTVGRFGQVVADNERLKDIEAKKSGIAGAAARLTLAAGRKTAGTSFDLRATGLGKNLGAGKAQEGGFAKDMKNRIEAEKKLAESFKPSDLVVNKAERELDAAKKSGDVARIQSAQKKVDELKGVSEEEARNRRMRELIIGGMSKKEAKEHLGDAESQRIRKIEEFKKSGNLTEEQAKKKWEEEFKKAVDASIAAGKTEDEARKEAEKTLGWKADSQKSLANERQEAYAKKIEEAKFMGMGNERFGLDKNRFAFIGPVNKEVKMSSIEIRKKIKEKKPAEKLAEELSKARDSADSSSGTSTPPPTGTTGAPSGGPTTPPPTPGPSPASP